MSGVLKLVIVTVLTCNKSHQLLLLLSVALNINVEKNLS